MAMISCESQLCGDLARKGKAHLMVLSVGGLRLSRLPVDSREEKGGRGRSHCRAHVLHPSCAGGAGEVVALTIVVVFLPVVTWRSRISPLSPSVCLSVSVSVGAVSPAGVRTVYSLSEVG